MVPRFRRVRRRRPPDHKTELPTTRQRDGQPTANPRPPQPQVLQPDGNPTPCCCRRDHRPAEPPSSGAEKVRDVLTGAGMLLTGIAACVPPDVLARMWQALLS